MVSRISKHLVVFATVVAVVMIMGPASAMAGDDGFTSQFGVEFIKIKPGAFQMGGDDTEKYEDVMPVHKVTISKGFYLGKTEITRLQWAEVMGLKTEKLENPDNPMERVTFDDVQLFLLKLNAKENTKSYRLPTEAEWEYAARAGSTTKYSFGDDPAQLGEYAWYYGNAKYTQPVGQLKANAWGLYDIHGNVYEWCNDFYGQEYYKDSPQKDPVGALADPEARKLPPRVARGGGWYSKADSCTSAFRSNSLSSQKFIGFRLAKDLD